MAHADAKSVLLALLGDYVPPPIARSFYAVTLRRSDLDPERLRPEELARAVHLLIEALPAYVLDKTRRKECSNRLEALLPDQGREVARSQPLANGARETPKAVSPTHDCLTVYTSEDVLATSSLVRDMAERVGFSPLLQTKIATAVTELARNLQLYARGGRVEVATIGQPPRGIEVVTTDRGPGIANLDAIFAGKYRSRTGMGMGLRGTRRLMDTFDITTSPSGTRVVVRKYLT